MRLLAPLPEPTPEERELLARRALVVRAPPVAAEDESSQSWVAEFPVGPDRFALPLAALRAVFPLRMVTALPLAPPNVLGVARFSGAPLTVFSLASLLGVRGWRQDPSVFVVVELSGGRRVGFDCEQTPRPIPLPRDQVQGAWARTSGALAELPLSDGGLLTLIDAARLLAAKGPLS